MSPPKASKLRDTESVISLVILTETHVREVYEKSISPNHKKVAEQSQRNTFILAPPDFMLSCSKAELPILLLDPLFTPSL